MKHFALVALLLAGCASTQSGNITTPSVVYDARVASAAGASQATVDRCVAEAQAKFDSGIMGQLDGSRAGAAYERCVRAAR